MKRARLQEDAQAYEAQISQAYTPIVAPPSQQINQPPPAMPSIAPPTSIVSQSAGNSTAPPTPMGSQSTSVSASSSSRPLLCCDDSSYDIGNSQPYEQQVPMHKYNSPPILKMSHNIHHPSPMEKYEAPPQSAYKYEGHHPQQQDYDAPAAASAPAHDYDPLPPQVPVASDEEPLVYPNVGVESHAEPPPMPDSHMPPGYFSNYPLETQGNLESQDPLDYSVLEALFEGGSYPPPGDAGNADTYQEYQQY